MALLSVEEALQRILDSVQPTEPEPVAIAQARGRVLAEPLQALVTQPLLEFRTLRALNHRNAVQRRLRTVGAAGLRVDEDRIDPK